MSTVSPSNTLTRDKSTEPQLLLPSRFHFPEIASLHQNDVASFPVLTTHLSESERTIVKRWGSAALENLYQLGERIERDQNFAAELAMLPSRNSAEAMRILSTDLPDLLMNAYVLDTTLGNAVDPIFYRGLPQSGRELADAALNLRRFLPAQLSSALQLERELSPELGIAPAFSVFSASQIETIGNAQLAAYKSRLAVQPGGTSILESMEKGPVNPDYQKLAKVISILTIENLRALGAPTLNLLREQCAHFSPSGWKQIGADAMCASPILSLENPRGKALQLPPSVVEQVAAAHHNAWLDARLLIENRNPTSASTQRIPSNISGDRRNLYISNMDYIAGMTLGAHIAHLPDAVFNRLVEVAAPHSPPLPKDILGTLQSPQKVESELPINTSILARRLEYPELLPQLDAVRKQIEEFELQRDFQLAAPVFTEIDRLNDSIQGRTFCELVGNLREIQRDRRSYAEQLKLGMLSIPAHTLMEEFVENLSDTANAPVRIQQLCSNRWRETIDQSFKDYERSRIWAATFPAHELPAGFCGTELLTPQKLRERYSEIAALIEVNSGTTESLLSLKAHESATPSAEQIRGTLERGKLMPGDYSLPYFERLLNDGNHVLYRPKDTQPGSGLDGLFVYYRPGNFPESIKELKAALSSLDDVAYESLFLTAQDRTKGTYMMLLRGMGARQALAGARFSFGTVSETNTHHFELLQAVDHFPLHGAPIILDALGNRFIPMLWQLP